MELVNISRKKKALVTVIVIIGVFFIIGAIANSSSRVANPNDITGITQFVVINDNGLYKARFSLNDQNNAFVSSDANVNFTMYGNQSGGYHSDENITADQFQDVSLVLTGNTFLAYSWQINHESVHGSPDLAAIEVTLPNGKRLEAHTTI